MKLISLETYNSLKAKIKVRNAWVDTQRNPKSGWANYREIDVPSHVPKVSNEETSQVEVYEFVNNPPEKYFVYVKRELISPGVYHPSKAEATTWTGDKLGDITLGKRFTRNKLGFYAYPVTMLGINGKSYYGTFYASDGDYAKIKMTKSA